MGENTKIIVDFTDADFTAPYQLELYNYWLTAKGGRLMPSRADISISDLSHYLSSIMLLDYHEENNLIVFRVIGTSCVKLYGEITNKTMNEFKEHEKAVDRILWCVENKKPYYAIKNLANINKDFVKTSFIVLPLSDDGENVNKILVSHHFYK